jgi:hypothetical protein
MQGTYGLKNENIDFRGELRLDAKLSETTSGLKSFLLKLVDPLFKTKDAGAVIPIRLSGTPDKPSFGVEVGRVLSGEEVTSPARGPASTGDGFQKSIPSCSDVLELEARDPTPAPQSTSAHR